MMKIGVMTPTLNRPDCIRSLVLQMQNQSRKPDLLVIHHNGNAQSYQWAIADIATDIEIVWLHTPEVISQYRWYSVSLQHLIEAGCTHFFWCDHDDFYYRNHIENGITALQLGDYDHVVNYRCDLVLLKKSQFEFIPNNPITYNPTGGMASSMCFNEQFAREMLLDLNKTHANPNANPHANPHADCVVATVTMPKFKCHATQQVLTAYIALASTVSTQHWVTEA